MPPVRAAALERDARALGASRDLAFFDPRTDRLTSLILREPLIPGDGDGNTLEWPDGVAPTDAALKDAVWQRVVEYLAEHAAILRVDVDGLGPPRIGVFEHGDLIQVYAQRHLDGIPVRDSSVTAIVNHGNLVLLGIENWGDREPAKQPLITVRSAQDAVVHHAAPFVVESLRGGDLEYVPAAAGSGIAYRLVRVVRADIRDDDGTWEGVVDAATGELLAFEDRNQYAGRHVIGGVYPVSSDQRPPDGIEQPGWPMPFANVPQPSGPFYATSAGGVGCLSGTIRTELVGRYGRINDMCGPIDESSASGHLDLGSGPTPQATDCAVPPGHSPGDTKAARTTFYALARVNEQARGYLPQDAWLQTPLLANVNPTPACGALWNGTFITLYRSNALCRNVGELAGVAVHEWAHGLDDNSVNPTISQPADAMSDLHVFLQTNQSCIGRGFFINGVCSGYGDPCLPPVATGCTGLRDIDFDRRACGRPHTITYLQVGFPAGHCVDGVARPRCAAGGGSPCGRLMWCEGQLVSETAFDLARRDLPASGLDAATSFELTTRLFYLAGQPVGAWYTCAVAGGCAATGGYLLTLAADDDDGNIGNGTPHMTAIRAAYARHEIHCATPPAVDFGCSGGPTAAPVLTAVLQGSGVALTWNAVAGAARYAVYRTEGVNGDTYGKVKLAEVTGTSYAVAALLPGHQYYYAVLPIGANSSCFGRMSNAAGVVPVAGADVGILPAITVARAGGDADDFLDNCESATVTFTVENSGTGPLTNVRLTAVQFLTHPASVLQTTLPAPIAASLADCASASGMFSFLLQGAAFAESTKVRVEVTADQLGGLTRSQVFTIRNLETDALAVPTRTYGFDADLQGWTVLAGTFARQAGGAQGSPFHVTSSENLADQCDAIRSPLFRLKANSTLSVWNRFQIEPNDPTAGPYDRANVGVRDLESGVRTLVFPSGGQQYTITPSASNGTCETTGQAGWNGTSPGYPAFNESTWNAGALNPGGVLTDRVASLEVRYGTDALLNPNGLDFDQVTLTSFDELVADTQSDTCVAQASAPHGLLVDDAGNDVYQPNETVAVAPTWRNTGTQAIALSGALTNHTGPAGATYTIPDGAASYGTIAVGGNASCTVANNCYSVANSATTRPATHWDTTALETVAPTATTKTWTLHVGDSFTDVPDTSPFYRFIETLLHHGVTGGCTGATYCPASSTTREQMAVFVLVSKESPGYTPPACATPVFADVPASSPFCRWIEELARRGVVAGCGGGNYCPTAPVTREQMSVFVLRTLDPALDPPACGTPIYADVPASSPFCRWIEELTRRGVVTGCGGGNYCPAAPVTREQMGVFLGVTFGLALYGV